MKIGLMAVAGGAVLTAAIVAVWASNTESLSMGQTVCRNIDIALSADPEPRVTSHNPPFLLECSNGECRGDNSIRSLGFSVADIKPANVTPMPFDGYHDRNQMKLQCISGSCISLVYKNQPEPRSELTLRFVSEGCVKGLSQSGLRVEDQSS